MKVLPNALAPNQSANGANKTDSQKDPKLWKAVQDFESILIYNMIKSMRETIPKSELTEAAAGKDYFMSMFDQEVAQNMTNHQNDSLAESIYQQLVGNRVAPPQSKAQPVPQVQMQSPIQSRPNIQPRMRVETRTRSNEHLNIYDRVNQFEPIIQEASQRHEVDQNLISAVIAQESAGNPNAVSHAGATGLMQLMEETAQDLGVQNRYDPKSNVHGGAKYLRQMLDQFDNDLELALAAYNAGPSAVRKYNGIPPYKETQNYVKRVLKYYQTFKNEESI